MIRPYAQCKGNNHKFFCMQNTNSHIASEQEHLKYNQQDIPGHYGCRSVYRMVFTKQEGSTTTTTITVIATADVKVY